MRKIIIIVLVAVIVAVALWFTLHNRRHKQMSFSGVGLALTVKHNSFSGVGLELTVNRHHNIFIAHVLPGTPAARAGLHGGLIIQEVNGTNVEGMTLMECVEMMRGPTDTTVQLEVIDTKNNETNMIDLTREKIVVPIRPVPVKTLPAAH